MEKIRFFISKYKNGSEKAKAGFWFLLCSFLQKVISTITTPIFTRLMSTDEYGNFNVFYSWMTLLTTIITLNLFYEIYEQGLVKFENKRSKFSSSLQGLDFTLVCIWGLIYCAFHKYINHLLGLSTFQILMMFLLIWSTSVFNFWAAEQRVQYKYKKLVFITIFTTFMSSILGIIFVKLSVHKSNARILAIVIVQMLSYTGLFFSQLKNGKKFYDKFFWKYAIVLALPLVPHYLSQTVLNTADRIMISKLVNESSAGIYSLAYSISLVMSMLNLTLNQTIGPWYFRKIKEKKIGELSRIIYPSFIFVAIANLVLIMFAPEIIKIFAPVEYYESINLIPPIAMSVYFTFSYDVFCKFEFYYEKSKTIAMITFIGAALNIVLNYIFISIFGYAAAAYTTLICYIFYAIGHYFSMRRICKKEFNGEQPYSTSKLCLITGIFLITGFLIGLTYNLGFYRIILIILLFAVLFIFRKRIIFFVKNIKSVKQN